MDKVVRLGSLVGLGLVALMSLLILLGGRHSFTQQQLSSQPVPQPADGARFAQVGETVKLQGWEVTLLGFGLYERFSSSPPLAPKTGGVLMVADLQIKNIQSRTSDFTLNDFVLKAGDGRRFGPAPETTNIERGLVAGETVQPDQRTDKRVVFDVSPNARDLVFEALEIEFTVPALGH